MEESEEADRISSGDKLCIEMLLTSTTAVLHITRITTDRTTFKTDKTLVQPFVFIKYLFVNRYILLNFASF